MNRLVLSIFPGIDLLGRAFEEEWPEACIVRGPDVVWGGDIRDFHPPAGIFDGVIGGPPCQIWSRLRYLNPLAGKRHGNMIPEFCRVVAEAAPSWWLMENVPEAPLPEVKGYEVSPLLLNNRWLGAEQMRLRRFCFGTRDGRPLDIEVALFEALLREPAVMASNAQRTPIKLNSSGKIKSSRKPPSVLAGHGPIGQGSAEHRENRTIPEIARLQGLPDDFLADAPFTMHGKRALIGNGVPLPMGRAIAKAVKKATN